MDSSALCSNQTHWTASFGADVSRTITAYRTSGAGAIALQPSYAVAHSWYAANHNAPDSTMVRLFGLVQTDVEAALGGAEFERLRSEGAAMPAAQAAALLRSEIGTASEQ